MSGSRDHLKNRSKGGRDISFNAFSSVTQEGNMILALVQRAESSRGVDLGSNSFHFLSESSYCRAWSKSAINVSSRPKVNQEVPFCLTQSSPINNHFGSLPAGIFTMAALTDLLEGCSFFRSHSKPVSLHVHKCPPPNPEPIRVFGTFFSQVV